MLIKSQHFDKAIEILKEAIEKKALPIDDLIDHLEKVKNAKRLYEKANPSAKAKEYLSQPKQPKVAKATDDEKPCVKKFAFTYDSIKPNKETGEELSFEEIRARVHYKAHEEAEKLAAKYQAKFMDDLKELKSK